jgi:poly(3-hydroxybutyrate) depolymerase
MTGKRLFLTLSLLGLLLQPSGHARTQPSSNEEAIDRLVLRRATTHPMRYYLSLPRGYVPNAGKKWPVLVVLAGNAANPFEESASAFFEARGDLPYLLVVPCTWNNHPGSEEVRPRFREIYPDLNVPPPNDRLAWDEAGLLAIIQDLRAQYDVEPSIYLDGFSAGAILAYHFTVMHPQELAGTVTVCGNFWDIGYRESRPPHAPQAMTVPVRIILGSDDPLRIVQWPTHSQQLSRMALRSAAAVGLGYLAYRWSRRRAMGVIVALLAVLVAGLWTGLHIQNIGNGEQAERAQLLLRELGYTDVQTSIIPGMSHDPSPGPTLEVFRPYWEAKSTP